MDFRLTEEQELFAKSVREFVNREAPKEWARAWNATSIRFPTSCSTS